MLSPDLKSVVEGARRIYEQELRSQLENSDNGKYVCIEPSSGDHFVGESFDEAVNLAIEAYPDRLTHTLRIGHDAALHLGAVR